MGRINDRGHSGGNIWRWQTIEKYVRKSIPSIRRNGFDRVMDGITTLQEVLRVTRED